MPENDFESLPLRLAYTFLDAHGLGPAADEIRSSRERLGSYTSTLKRAKVAALLKREGILDQFIAAHWINGNTAKGKQLIDRLARIYERYESSGAAVDQPDSEIEEATDSGFAYEEHLRDFLADHLDRLEQGLSLWPVGPEADAVEFPVGGRRIDILAQDDQKNAVVIELKVSRGHEKTIGQCLYYRAKIRELFKQETVRIFIVAQEISDELKVATRELKNVELFEYALSFNVTRL